MLRLTKLNQDIRLKPTNINTTTALLQIECFFGRYKSLTKIIVPPTAKNSHCNTSRIKLHVVSSAPCYTIINKPNIPILQVTAIPGARPARLDSPTSSTSLLYICYILLLIQLTLSLFLLLFPLTPLLLHPLLLLLLLLLVLLPLLLLLPLPWNFFYHKCHFYPAVSTLILVMLFVTTLPDTLSDTPPAVLAVSATDIPAAKPVAIYR